MLIDAHVLARSKYMQEGSLMIHKTTCDQKLNAAKAARTATVMETSRCDAAPLAGRVATLDGALYGAVRVASLEPETAAGATVAVWLNSE